MTVRQKTACIFSGDIKKNRLIFIILSLVLSAITHLWNPVGFPDLFYDEGVYIGRALHFLQSNNPQEGYFHGHPVFGQVFLGMLLKLTEFTDTTHYYHSKTDTNNNNSNNNLDDSVESIKHLYLLPRIWMGILSVLDTLLVYKICETRYNCRVAALAAILFAVMPITWFTRRVLLDSILLPFFLASVFFAIFSKTLEQQNHKYVVVLLSGIFLGLSIFIKISTVVMIPMVCYLVYYYSISKSKAGFRTGRRNLVLLWFIPLIAIPSLWPIQSFVDNQFDQWVSDVWLQSTRATEGIIAIFQSFMIVDPVFMLLGFLGIVYTILKKEYFIMLWILPFACFSSVFYTQYFHVIPVIPAWCIAAGLLIDRTMSIIRNLAKQLVVQAITFTSIILFGLISTLMIISADLSSSQFETAVYAFKYAIANSGGKNDTTIIASPVYTSMYTYVFHAPHAMDYLSTKFYQILTKNIILISDPHYLNDIQTSMMSDDLNRINANISSRMLKTFYGNVLRYDIDAYPYGSMRFNYEGSIVTINQSTIYLRPD
ncbi:MAG: glycosyltransferase family 39 protein [Thermoproteota archaeon]|nr:glycosyltransferase family 39 protein [Thermoproteota archaeon]